MEVLKEKWVEEMIEREATVASLRKESNEDFYKKWGISKSLYYYERAKKENQEKILDICLNLAKKYTPEIMENLGIRAQNNSKDAELFMEYVLALKKNIDVTTDGEKINSVDLDAILSAYAQRNNNKTESPSS